MLNPCYLLYNVYQQISVPFILFKIFDDGKSHKINLCGGGDMKYQKTIPNHQTTKSPQTMSLKLAKTADQRTRDTVFGFVKDSTHHTVPLLVSYMCLSYFMDQESFSSESHSKQLIISSSDGICHQNDTATYNESHDAPNPDPYEFPVAFGDYPIDLERERQTGTASIEWTLKIRARQSEIRICPFDSNISHDLYYSFGWNSSGAAYQPSKCSKCITRRGPSHFGLGSVVKMKLDINERILTFYRNDEMAVSFKDIELKGNHHRMAVIVPPDVWHETASVQIIGFKITKLQQ